MPDLPPGEPYEYATPMRALSPLPPLVRANAVLHALVRHALTTLPGPPAPLRITHHALGRASHSAMAQLTPSGWRELTIADTLHTHLATLRARTVISGTPPWFTATIIVTPQPSATDDPFSLEATFDLTQPPQLHRPLGRTDYEDDLNFFARPLTQMPDWFIAGLLAPADDTATHAVQSLIKTIMTSASNGDTATALAAFGDIAPHAFVAAPLALAVATRAVTYPTQRLRPHPPLGTPSLVPPHDPIAKGLAMALLPALVADLRAELIYLRDGTELVTRVATTTTLLTTLTILADQPPETVGYVVDQAWVDYQAPGRDDYFAQTMAHIRETSAQLFHTWAVSALLVSSDPSDRALAACHCTQDELSVALDDEHDTSTLEAMLQVVADLVDQGTDISDTLPGVNTACYRLLARHATTDDIPTLRTLIATGALATALYTRLALPPTHPRIRAAALNTGLAAPTASDLAAADPDQHLRLTAVTSGQLSPATLATLQLHDPDPKVALAATLALSRRSRD